MLVAMQAGGGKVGQIIGSAVHQGVLVLDGGTRRAALCELAPAIAAYAALPLHQLPAYPHPIPRILQVLHIPLDAGNDRGD
jgi:hypothetical protein